MSDLTDRIVVVTGAGGGIGAAIAARVTEAGGVVIGVDRSAGPGVRAFDVTDPAQWKVLADELASAGVRGLVNCAGITRRARLDAVTAVDMAEAYAVNVIGPTLGIQALAPLMPSGGSIVNIGSIAACTAHYPVAYTTSKWALRGLTHTAALALGDSGIRVNIVHPGFIDTPMTASAAPVFRDASIAETALGRAGRPDEVAGTVEYLLGSASSYTTGAEITVDGGATSHGGVKSIADALFSAVTR